MENIVTMDLESADLTTMGYVEVGSELGIETLPAEFHGRFCTTITGFLFAGHQGKLYAQVYSDPDQLVVLRSVGFVETTLENGYAAFLPSLREFLREFEWFQAIENGNEGNYPEILLQLQRESYGN